MRNVEPSPSALVHVRAPPWSLVTMSWASDSPSPVPSPVGLVVKNGSKMRACVAASMPVPLSSISIVTASPSARASRRVRTVTRAA